MTLKKSTNALSARALAEAEAVAGTEIGLEEARTVGAVALRLVVLHRVAVVAGARVVARRQRLGDRPVPIGIDVAVGQAERASRQGARITQLKFRPPVCGTSAVPLTTKLWR